MVPLSKEISTKLLADVNKKNTAELEKLKADTEKLIGAIKTIKDVKADTITYLDYLQLVLKSGGENDKTVPEKVSFMQEKSNVDGDMTTGAVTTAMEQLRDLQKLAQSRDLDLLSSNNSSASLSVRLKSIQVINTILKRFRLSFDVAVLIHELGVHLDSKLQEWLEDLRSGNILFSSPSSSSSTPSVNPLLGESTVETTAAAPSSKEKLKNAENIFRHLLSIKNWYQSLLPADLPSTVQKLNAFAAKVAKNNAPPQNFKKLVDATKNLVSTISTQEGKTEQVLDEKNKRSYLVDLAKDASSSTVSNLIIHLV